MRTRELLENDKERLYARLEKADTPEQTINALEETLNRIQIRYGESEADEAISREASYALQTAKAALSLVDCTGEIRTYERSDSAAKTKAGKYLIPIASGCGLGLLGAVMLAAASAAFTSIGGILLAAGLGMTFVGGYNFGKRKNLPDSKEQYIDVRLDSDKIYRGLSTMLTVVDHNLEETRQDFREEDIILQDPADVPDEELRLLSSLLENAYTAADTEESRQTISDISFYLHKRGIDVVDYSENAARYFNRMPAAATRTLKPALVKDDTILIRGMAAVKK